MDKVTLENAKDIVGLSEQNKSMFNMFEKLELKIDNYFKDFKDETKDLSKTVEKHGTLLSVYGVLLVIVGSGVGTILVSYPELIGETIKSVVAYL